MSEAVENLEQIVNNDQSNETIVSAEQHDIPDVEKEARMLGWRSQEEYKGPGWKPAEDWVAEKKTTLTTEVRALRQTLNQQSKSVDALLAHQARKEEADRKAGYEQAMREINSRIADAAKVGNVTAINELNTARENLVRVDEAQRIQHQNTITQEPAEVSDWKSKNDWFNKDDDLTRYAKAYELELTQKGVPLATRLQMTAEKVKLAFPYKFDQQRRTQNTTMTTQNRTVGGNINKVEPGTYEALTPEWKKECDKAFQAMGGRAKVEDFRANYVRYAKPDMFQN